MPILPLPQFEADLAEQDRLTYERLKPPSSIVARFGIMKMVGEFPYSGEAKPGCGSKLVIKTHRGTELGEMLTSTCPNSGCSKSVTRQEMLEYIENSGGRDYPFFSMQGKVLRIAIAEDLNEQARIDSSRPQMTRQARAIAEGMRLTMKVIDSEPILGGEKLTFYFTSEDRVDFRELVTELASIHHTRIEMRQVGARDEARLTADYERCGQHCCCKQFLKVLKPISMKSAKIQKATLDPLKISGRCGRLMCCLRYEDQTYDELRAKLPRKKSRVKTPDGWGIVLDGQILTQLVLVLMDGSNEQVAVPIEDLEDPATAGPPPPVPPPGSAPAGPPPRESRGRDGDRRRDRGPGAPPAPSRGPDRPQRPAAPEPRPSAASEADELMRAMETDFGDGSRAAPPSGPGPERGTPGDDRSGSGRGRRRRRGRSGGGPEDSAPPNDRGNSGQSESRAPDSGDDRTPSDFEHNDAREFEGDSESGSDRTDSDSDRGPGDGGGEGGGGGGRRRRRRRRRRGGGGGGGGNGPQSGPPPASPE